MAAAKRVAIIDGVRTPFARAFGVYKKLSAAELGKMPTNELLARTEIDPSEVDAVVFGWRSHDETPGDAPGFSFFRTVSAGSRRRSRCGGSA